MSDEQMGLGLHTFLCGGSELLDDAMLQRIEDEANRVLNERALARMEAKRKVAMADIDLDKYFWMDPPSSRVAHLGWLESRDPGWGHISFLCGTGGWAIQTSGPMTRLKEQILWNRERDRCKKCSRKAEKLNLLSKVTP